MEKSLKKMLIGFFAVMALCTVVSRAAASVMVPKVTAESVKRDTLTFELSGTGTIVGNAKKYIDLITGYKIGKMYVNPQDTVEKGEVLFAYDMKELQKARKSLLDELKKLQLQYEKAALNGNSDFEITSASLSRENAESDYKDAKKDITDLKRQIGKMKKQEYEEALPALKEMKGSKEDEERAAKRTVEDAVDELEKLTEPEERLLGLLDHYKAAAESKKEEEILKVRTSIFELYYNDKYKEHQIQVEDGKKRLARAEDDLRTAREKWKTVIDENDRFSDDEDVRKTYEQLIRERNAEIKNYRRAVSDETTSLDQLTREDEKLDKALQKYRGDIMSNNMNAGESYQELYQIIYDGLNLNKKEIEMAKKKVSRAGEDEEKIRKRWEEKYKNAKMNTDKLYQDILDIKKGTYDYEEEIKAGKKAAKDAKRSIRNARLKEQEVQNVDALNQENERIDLESIQLDIDEKQNEIAKINKILQKKGKVMSPVDGVIHESDLEYGMTITGSEKLAISTGGYELTMEAEKENMKYFSVGDEIVMKSYNSSDTMTSQIESIKAPDKDGKVKFTSLLSERDYTEGNTLDFELKKESGEYRTCIPLTAIRQNAYNTYILLVKEKDSILGKEETAFPMNVTVIQKDRRTAAIEGSFTNEDRIITGSSKDITEGDRVRVYEEK